MFKKKHIILLFAFLTCSFVSAQELKENSNKEALRIKNSLRIHPINLLGSQIGFSYERRIKLKESLNFSLIQEFEKDDNNSEFDNSTYYYACLGVDYRFYLKEGIKGWLISPGISASYERLNRIHRASGNKDTYVGEAVSTVMAGGYQWILNEGVTFGVTLGGEYELSFKESSVDHNILPAASVTAGFSW